MGERFQSYFRPKKCTEISQTQKEYELVLGTGKGKEQGIRQEGGWSKKKNKIILRD